MKKLLWGLFCVFLCGAFISPASALVWEVTNGGNGHDYKLVYFASNDKEWDDARSALNSTGYTVAAITSAKEQQFFQDYPNKEADPYKKDLWLAGEANDYYDNRWGVPNIEQFLSVRSAFGWGWNDERNLGRVSGYKAETAAVPEPGTIILMGFGLLGIATISRKKFLQS